MTMSKQCISTEKAPAAIGPYSQAVRHGDTLYVSGQIPLDPVSKEMADDVREQTRQSMNNIRAIVEAAGSSMDKVIRCGIFVTDLADFTAINEEYAAFFSGDYPARATVQVAALPLGAKVEIDAIAAL
jgi:2-iminobutanoate/2-iminopropanoate deaminase